MGFYVGIGRPRGSGEILADAIAEVLNQRDYLEHVKVNEWWSPGGILTLVREQVTKAFADWEGATLPVRQRPTEPPQRALVRAAAWTPSSSSVINTSMPASSKI